MDSPLRLPRGSTYNRQTLVLSPVGREKKTPWAPGAPYLHHSCSSSAKRTVFAQYQIVPFTFFPMVYSGLSSLICHRAGGKDFGKFGRSTAPIPVLFPLFHSRSSLHSNGMSKSASKLFAYGVFSL